MQYQLLGPVQASEGGRVVDLGPQKQRALLALLVLEQRPVSLARATASKMVQIYVSGLRKALGPESIRTTPTGYELTPDGAEVDVERFRALRAAARGHERRRAA